MDSAYAHLKPRRVTDGLEFPEGPVALASGDVLVSEIRGGRITRVRPDGTRSTCVETGGGPNGAAVGPGGALWVCNNGGSRWAERPWPYQDPDAISLLLPAGHLDGPPGPCIQRVDVGGGSVDRVHTACNGTPLKRPNDIVFDVRGGFWFTDSGGTHGRVRDVTGIYYVHPGGSPIVEAIYPLDMPNGIGLSPDGQTLYIAETRTRRIWACVLEAPGRVKSRRTLATVPAGGPLGFGGCDSLCVDAEGNVIVATIGAGGVTVVSPAGGLIAHVPLGDPMTTNACFGGADRRTL